MRVGPGNFRERGAFFTSFATSALVASKLQPVMGAVLEPSCGYGELIAAIANRPDAERTRLIGVELDPVTADAAKMRFADVPSISVQCEDFMNFDEGKFDTVVANPPFIRHHAFTEAQRLRFAEMKRRFAVQGLTSRASMWAYFLLHSLELLNLEGQVAFILPAEYEFAEYASGLRSLVRSSFERVEVVPLGGALFSGAQVSAVLLVASGYRGLTHGAEEIQQAETSLTGFESLHEWGRLSIGTVTGANGFFLLTQADLDQNRIPYSDVRRVIPPRRQMKGGVLRYGLSEWIHDRDLGARVYLWMPVAPMQEGSSSYAGLGRDLGVPYGYKARSRPSWFHVQPLVSGRLLLPYISGNAPALIHNAMMLPHVNSLHGLTLSASLRHLADVAALASASSATALSMEHVGRSYGAGGLKLEISGAKRIQVPNREVLQAFKSEIRRARIDVSFLSMQALRSTVDDVLLGQVLAWSRAQIDQVQRELLDAHSARVSIKNAANSE